MYKMKINRIPVQDTALALMSQDSLVLEENLSVAQHFFKTSDELFLVVIYPLQIDTIDYMKSDSIFNGHGRV